MARPLRFVLFTEGDGGRNSMLFRCETATSVIDLAIQLNHV